MSHEDERIKASALDWARRNKKAFARRLTNLDKYPGETNPVSVFMAGSPGAGKTEASKALLKRLNNDFLRIDPDEFRHCCPGYTGSNSWLFQGAVSILLSKVLDYAFKQQQSFLLDGTLSNEKTAFENVRRALGKKRDVLILYVYQDPYQAWRFVQAREVLEGRRIPAESFIEQLFDAREVVQKLKAEFSTSVQVDVILKDLDGGDRRFAANVSNLDAAAPLRHSRQDLRAHIDRS
ncbi:MAG: zeta toxin family protein [Porticoccaceae bacterium]